MQELQAVEVKLDHVMNESLGAEWHSLNLASSTGPGAGCILEFFLLGVLGHGEFGRGAPMLAQSFFNFLTV